jgi:hypothetical protein
MIPPQWSLIIVTAVFTATLLLSLVMHGAGVIRNDPARNIWIPDELTMPLTLQVAFNDEDIFFRYRWPADQPRLHPKLLRYTDGRWEMEPASPHWPGPESVHEDRLSMMVDDGSVPDFQRYGGYITIGSNMRDFTPGAAAGDEDGYRRKYLPATRLDPGDWYSIADAETLEALDGAGYFLDLWNWRARLSDPVGHADDQHISWFRLFDSGEGPFTSNWDGAAEQPRYMFDPEQTGMRALRPREAADRVLGQDDAPYLEAERALPFDPRHEWQEGDALPARLLREPSGARAAVRVRGEAHWVDGQWDVTLQRALDTGFPLEDKIFRPTGVYDVAIAVHRDGSASRWHYVSMPLQIGLERQADLVATRISGDRPDWEQMPAHQMTLFYPGQVSWPRLTSRIHAGAQYIAEGVPVKFRHKEAQLAQYGVEIEYESEIRRQWWLSLLTGLLLIASFVLSVRIALVRGEA